MLAILEDGFSTVSQINYIEKKDSAISRNAGGEVGTNSIFSKLLKINVSGEIESSEENSNENSVAKEKVHTNVSLLSKFYDYLVDEKILKKDIDIKSVLIGDFVEVQGELEKNPLIEFLGILVDFFRIAKIFEEQPQLGDKNKAKLQKQKDMYTPFRIGTGTARQGKLCHRRWEIRPPEKGISQRRQAVDIFTILVLPCSCFYSYAG